MSLKNNQTAVYLSPRTQAIIDGTVSVVDLDLSVAEDVADVRAAISAAPETVFSRLSLDDVASQEFLFAWVKMNPENLLQIPANLYFPEIMEIYFYHQIKETAPETSADCNFTIYKGVDGYYSLDVHYETDEGEEIRYIDSQLKMPVAMRSKFDSRVKIYDIIKFLSAIDVDLATLTYSQISAYVKDMLLNAYRTVIMAVVDKKQVGYYSLARYYRTISGAMMSLFEGDFDRTGILLTEFQIRELALPQQALDQAADHYYAYRELEREMEFRNRCEQLSLDTYERKAEIHEKCQSFPVGMTEAEKDFAFDRFLKKMGRYERSELKGGYDPNSSKLLTQNKHRAGATPDEILRAPAAPMKPVMEQIPTPPSYIPRNTTPGFVFLLLLSIFMTAVAFYVSSAIFGLGSFVGFVVAGIAVFVLGLYRAHMETVEYNNRKFAPEYADYMKRYNAYIESKNSYPERMQRYNEELKQHEADMDEYHRRRALQAAGDVEIVDAE